MRTHTGFLLLCTCLVLACGGDGGGPSGSTATMSGTVTSVATGGAVAGATVRVGSAQATSDASGRFEFTGLQPGASVVISCARDGFLPYSATIVLQEGSNSRNIVLATQETFEFGEFAVFVPNTATQVRGVVVGLGPLDTRAFVDGRPTGCCGGPEEVPTQRFGARLRVLARDSNLAVLGTALPLSDLSDSDALVLGALVAGATASGHPELSSAPLIVLGISFGGREAFGLARRQPDRVAAFALHNTRGMSQVRSAATQRVLGFIDLPGVDSVLPNAETIQTFLDNRAEGAIWELAVEPGRGPYELTEEMSNVLIRWLTTAAGLRLPAAAGGPLRTVEESSGWLGNRATFEIAPYGTYGGNPQQASWLPTAAAAAEWRDLVTP